MSGTATLSSVLNRVLRSSIVVTQVLAQPLSTTAEIGPHGEAVGAEPRRDVAHGEVLVKEKKNRRALPLRHPPHRAKEVRVGIAVDLLAVRAPREYRIARFQRARGDPEGRPPGPSGGIAEGWSSTQRLRESFGDRVAGDVGITRKREDRSPQAVGMVPIYLLDAGCRFDHSCHTLHR